MKHIIAQNTEKNANTFSASVEWSPSKGEQVLVRTADGTLVTRRVWEIGDRVVYVCTDRVYGELQTGGTLMSPIGFPKWDVFRLQEDTETTS